MIRSSKPEFGIGAIVLVLGLNACGGEQKPEAKSPETAPTSAPVATTTGAAPQYGMSDAPTSGETVGTRPSMNAVAAQAYQAGLQAFQNGDLAGAKAQFQKATQSDPKAYQAYYSTGVVRERLGDSQNALADYRQATLIVPDYEPALAAYAVLLARLGKTDQAEEYLNGRMASMPKSAAVVGALAEVKSIQGDSGAAQRYAQEALKRNPDYRPAMVTLARDHYRNRRLDLALYALKGILDGYGEENPARDKNNAEAHLIRGLIFREQGFRAPAIDEFHRAIELRPDLVEARVNLATYLLEAGNAVDAAPQLEAAIRYDIDNVPAHLALGDAYRLLGKITEARRELEWVQKADPKLAQVHYDLGLLFLFAENIPGVTPAQAADRAIEELELFKTMKAKVAGSNDDTEELLTRAKTKKAVLEAKASEPPPAPASAAPATPAAAPAPAKAPAPAPSKGSTGSFGSP